MITKNNTLDIHKDAHNLTNSLNFVASFGDHIEGGGTWVTDAQGNVPRSNKKGEVLMGRNLDNRNKFVAIDPKEWHASVPWTG